MEYEKDLRDTIFFQEQMLKTLGDEMRWEQRYLIQLNEEKKKNSKGFYRFLFFAILFGCICIVNIIYIWMIEYGYGNMGHTSVARFYIMAVSTGMDIMFYLLGLLVFAFSGLALLFCVYKLLYYAKRITKEQDNRDGRWKTYKEMKEISEKRFEKLGREQGEMLAKLTANRELLILRQQERLVMTETAQPDFIEFDELMQVKIENKMQEKQYPLDAPLKKA